MKVAITKLQKKHLAALLLLTNESVKGSESKAVLLPALEKKLSDEDPVEEVNNMRSLVSLFHDIPSAPTLSSDVSVSPCSEPPATYLSSLSSTATCSPSPGASLQLQVDLSCS
eukprot:scpid104990/ scgid23881/ 